MVKKSKGRQKIEMVKMENESNLQVTFSKRRAGLFKKASELCTLCGAEVAIIVFSPGRKVFSFGHPNVETVVDRFLNNNPPPPPHQQNQLQLGEVHRNTVIQDLNNHLTEVLNQLEMEKKKNEELRKIRENTKKLGNWMEDAIEGFSLAQVHEFKGHLENLKKTVALEASKIFEAHIPQQNYYGGSSSNAGGYGNEGGGDINNPDVDMFGQRRMMNNNNMITPFNYNQNTNLPNNPLPFGNNEYGNVADQGLVPGYNTNYMPEYQYQNPNQNQNQLMNFPNQNQNQLAFPNQNQNQLMTFPSQNQNMSFPNQNMSLLNQNQNLSFKEENTSEFEHLQGYLPRPGAVPSGAGPPGVGPSGAGPSGVGPSGAGPSGAGPPGYY